MTHRLVTPSVSLVLIFGLGGCADPVTAPHLIGEWGGEHVALSVTTEGATLEYDCAHGTIDEQIVPDREGVFDVRGVHVREHGGPIREGEIPDAHPARYEGWTNGTRMLLRVTLVDTGDSVGTYQLRLGSPGRVYKCL